MDRVSRPHLHLCGDAHYLPVQDDAFDGVVLEEMLEHCQSPHRVVEGVQRVLWPEGKRILTAPFLNPLHDRPGDYCRFTEHGLRYLLRSFSSLSIAPHHSGHGSVIVLFERLIMEPGRVRYLRFVVALVAFLMPKLDPVVTPLLRLETYSTGYFVTAVK
ncbi:MAG: methyltransferase domain-containing protein [Armatimonadetes bacterium]|nr:methyltransferase domain-containing protein [Armatimonadota bacterium]